MRVKFFMQYHQNPAYVLKQSQGSDDIFTYKFYIVNKKVAWAQIRNQKTFLVPLRRYQYQKSTRTE